MFRGPWGRKDHTGHSRKLFSLDSLAFRTICEHHAVRKWSVKYASAQVLLSEVLAPLARDWHRPGCLLSSPGDSRDQLG